MSRSDYAVQSSSRFAGDGRLKRLAARDIFDQHVKFRELDELTQRIEAIEDRLRTQR